MALIDTDINARVTYRRDFAETGATGTGVILGRSDGERFDEPVFSVRNDATGDVEFIGRGEITGNAPALLSTTETPTPVTSPSLEEWAAKNVQHYTEAVADRLRDLADRLDRRAAEPVSYVTSTPYAERASSVVREVHNLLSNLPLGQLVTQASVADQGRAAGHPKES